MPGSEEFIQSAVHALEAGGLAVWVKRGAITLGIVALFVLYLYQFRGLSTSVGMDQAQIGRAIASGEGWKTKLARPLAVGQLQAHGRDVAQNIWVDTYNAPLPPLVNAIALLPVKAFWKMNIRTIVYPGDKAIATMSILLFIASVAVLYFAARRLFDQHLALLACGLVILAFCALVYVPWLIRNLVVCGNIGGVAIYSFFNGIGHDEWGWMRRTSIDVNFPLGALRHSIIGGVVSQTSHLFEYFGLSV